MLMLLNLMAGIGKFAFDNDKHFSIIDYDHKSLFPSRAKQYIKTPYLENGILGKNQSIY